jgi:hypothetical protein
MFEDENGGSFEDAMRSVARELGQAVERAVDRIELDDVADSIGIDPLVARGWIATAASWLRVQTEGLGEEVARRIPGRAAEAGALEQLSSAAPHPLDVPTEEQGVALAALDSGRWTIEPGAHTLASDWEGPAPDDALGLVRELRVRDWITAEGEMTLAGRHALSRWLDAAKPR